MWDAAGRACHPPIYRVGILGPVCGPGGVSGISLLSVARAVRPGRRSAEIKHAKKTGHCHDRRQQFAGDLKQLVLGQDKTRSICRELVLQLRNKTPKRRVKAKLRHDNRIATEPKEDWTMDFVHDQLLLFWMRVLTIVMTVLAGTGVGLLDRKSVV